MNLMAEKANIAIIAGDTKIMPRGTLNEIIIATTGIGMKDKKIRILDNGLKTGDTIILTGSVGDHGTARQDPLHARGPAKGAHSRTAGDRGVVGQARHAGQEAQRGHEAEAGDRPGPDDAPQGPVPGRAHHRARPPNQDQAVGVHPQGEPGGDHHLPDHPSDRGRARRQGLRGPAACFRDLFRPDD